MSVATSFLHKRLYIVIKYIRVRIAACPVKCCIFRRHGNQQENTLSIGTGVCFPGILVGGRITCSIGSGKGPFIDNIGTPSCRKFMNLSVVNYKSESKLCAVVVHVVDGTSVSRNGYGPSLQFIEIPQIIIIVTCGVSAARIVSVCLLTAIVATSRMGVNFHCALKFITGVGMCVFFASHCTGTVVFGMQICVTTIAFQSYRSLPINSATSNSVEIITELK